MKKLLTAAFVAAACLLASAQTIKPFGPVPSPRQQQWQQLDFYLFTHFGPNTFTDLEWGKGTEHEEVFNPTQLDCKQWCRIAKAAGAKGIIITAKHHDGFCLWPSKYSKHTVAQSKWRGGKGDVLRELSDACKEYGLKMGIYLSPWDRNHPKYGTAAYNTVFINMMKEVVSRYGPLFEFWWDGANGEGPNGKKQVYEWHRFETTMHSIAPNTPVFSDIGPDIRWVGNESGFAGTTNWNTLDTAGFTRGAGGPSQDTLNSGNVNGHVWIPAECDVSIRPGWFYHASEDGQVKTPEQLFQLYVKSVGRGANLLLNVPPDRRGLINENDSAALVGFRELREQNFEKNLAAIATITLFANNAVQNITNELTDGNTASFANLAPAETSAITIKFNSTQTINCIQLQEPIQFGQRVKSFTISIKKNGSKGYSISGTTIGKKRILTFPSVEADSFTITVTGAKAAPLISDIAAYKIDDGLVGK
jgi:alpha-L-fucosidase